MGHTTDRPDIWKLIDELGSLSVVEPPKELWEEMLDTAWSVSPRVRESRLLSARQVDALLRLVPDCPRWDRKEPPLAYLKRRAREHGIPLRFPD